MLDISALEEAGPQDGQVFLVKRGRLVLIPQDDDEATRRVTVSAAAYEAVLHIQKGMRKHMGGLKPDVSMVATAMLIRARMMPDVYVHVARMCSVLSAKALSEVKSAETSQR